MNFIIVGDIILDHNIYTTIQNPKLIDYNTEYNLQYEEYKLGGCGNVAINLAALGSTNIYLFGAIGTDDPANIIKRLLSDSHIHNHMVSLPQYNTTIKKRYYHDNKCVFQYANTVNKELLSKLSFCAEIEKIVTSTKIDCILLCESEKSSNGILSVKHCQQLIALANKYKIPVIVDPKEDIDKYRGCTLIKPNRDEAYALVEAEPTMLMLDIHKNIMERLKCTHVLITLSEEGASLYDGVYEIRDRLSETVVVVDTIGAGDIVTSIMTFFYGKIEIKDALRIAVSMASKSVEKTGVIAVSRKDIADFLFKNKTITFEQLAILRTLFYDKQIGLTSGCFDLLHDGHIDSLKWCKEKCDILVLCLNSDASVKLLKGDLRPVQNVETRLATLQATELFDYIIIFDECDTVSICKDLKPDLYMKGGDYLDRIPRESEFVNKTIIGPYLNGISTTLKINTMRVYQFYCKPSHYGDNIFNLRFFYNISPLLKDNNVSILYFYDPAYSPNKNELERYIDKSTLTLLPIGDSQYNNPTNLWMGDLVDGIDHRADFIEYFNRFYIRISNILHITVPTHYTNFFQNEPYLEEIYNRLNPKFKDVDILILNSVPQSAQFRGYDKNRFNSICIKLRASPYKIVTTTHVNNDIVCTFDDHLNIQDIGAISTKAKYIIAVLSGPITACFNKLTIENVRGIFLLCDKKYNFKHKKITTYDKLTRLHNRLGDMLNALKNESAAGK